MLVTAVGPNSQVGIIFGLLSSPQGEEAVAKSSKADKKQKGKYHVCCVLLLLIVVLKECSCQHFNPWNTKHMSKMFCGVPLIIDVPSAYLMVLVQDSSHICNPEEVC